MFSPPRVRHRYARRAEIRSGSESPEDQPSGYDPPYQGTHEYIDTAEELPADCDWGGPQEGNDKDTRFLTSDHRQDGYSSDGAPKVTPCADYSPDDDARPAGQWVSNNLRIRVAEGTRRILLPVHIVPLPASGGSDTIAVAATCNAP